MQGTLDPRAIAWVWACAATGPRLDSARRWKSRVENCGGWGVAPDGRALKTPKELRCVPSKSLAMAIAAGGRQSGRSIRPFMPLMALVATSIDQMTQEEVRDFHVKLLEFFRPTLFSSSTSRENSRTASGNPRTYPEVGASDSDPGWSH